MGVSQGFMQACTFWACVYRHAAQRVPDNADMTLRHHQAIPLSQAAEEAPVLGSLMARVRLSQSCGEAIRKLIPVPMRRHIAFGAVEEGEWCLIVSNNAAAAKARQLLPVWVASLQRQGLPVNRIRLHLNGNDWGR